MFSNNNSINYQFIIYYSLSFFRFFFYWQTICNFELNFLNFNPIDFGELKYLNEEEEGNNSVFSYINNNNNNKIKQKTSTKRII